MRSPPAFPCRYDYAESEKARYDRRTSSRPHRPEVVVTVLGADRNVAAHQAGELAAKPQMNWFG